MEPLVTMTILLTMITGLVGIGLYLAIARSAALSFIPLAISVGLTMSPLLPLDYSTNLHKTTILLIFAILMLRIVGVLKK